MAQQDKIDEALQKFNQQLRAERARIQLLNDIVGRVVRLAEAVDELLIYHRQQIYREDSLREWLEIHAERMDRIEQSLLHLLAGRSNGDKDQIARARDEIKADLEVSSLRRQLSKQYKNLFHLQEQKAAYGGGIVPLDLLNKIEVVEEEIEKLQARMKPYETR